MKGKQVKHVCNNPNCNLTGIVFDTWFYPMKSKRGKFYFRWVLVDWDQIDFKEWIPRKLVKEI